MSNSNNYEDKQSKNESMDKRSTNGKRSSKRTRKNRVGGGTPRGNSGRTSDSTKRDYRDNLCNDPRWYIPTDQNLADVATFSFNHPAGYRNGNHRYYTPYTDNSSFFSKNRTETVPGVASLVLMPTIGMALDQTDAVNIAAVNMYGAS